MTSYTAQHPIVRFTLFCALLVSLFACRQAPAPASTAGSFAFEGNPTSVSVALKAYNPSGLTLSTVTAPGETRILVPDVDLEMTDYSYEFQEGNKLVIQAAFKNITQDFEFVQPFFFTVDEKTENIVSSTEPEVTDAVLGGDGSLSPGEKTSLLTFEVIHRGGRFSYYINVNAAVREAGSADTLPAPWQAADLGPATNSASSYDATTETFALSATSADDTDACRYVYQPLDENGSISAQVQSLTTDAADAQAGLMLRQSNSPDAAYALVALTPDGVVAQTKEGGESEPTQTGGSDSAAPVYLKLEREGEAVRVSESEDGVTFTLITAVTLGLSSPVNVGIVVCTPASQVQAQFAQVEVVQEDPEPPTDEPLTVQVPYEVDLEAFPTATSTATIFGEYQRPLDPGGEGTIEAANFDHPLISPLISANLYNTEGDVIARDYLVENVKESFDFTVENAARGTVLFSPVFGGFPKEDQVAVYQRIDQHPRFSELVELIRSRGRVPESGGGDELYFDLWYTISTDVAVQYIKDLGLLDVEDLKDNNLRDQTTPDDGSLPLPSQLGDESLEEEYVEYFLDIFQNPGDPYSFTVESDGTLAVRLFFYQESDSIPSDPRDFVNNYIDSDNSFVESNEALFGFIPINSTFQEVSLPVTADCTTYIVVASAFAPAPPDTSVSSSPRANNIASALKELTDIVLKAVGKSFPDELDEEQLAAAELLAGTFFDPEFVVGLAGDIEDGNYEAAAAKVRDWFTDVDNQENLLELLDIDADDIGDAFEEVFGDEFEDNVEDLLGRAGDVIGEFLAIKEIEEIADGILYLVFFVDALNKEFALGEFPQLKVIPIGLDVSGFPEPLRLLTVESSANLYENSLQLSSGSCIDIDYSLVLRGGPTGANLQLGPNTEGEISPGRDNALGIDYFAACTLANNPANPLDTSDFVLEINGEGRDDLENKFVSDQKVLKLRCIDPLIDNDDKTPDGNQLKIIGTGSPAGGSDDGVANLSPDLALSFLGADYTGGGPGDGTVDMADFRRLRDWLLSATGSGQFIADTRHPKLDLSEDPSAYGDHNDSGQFALGSVTDERTSIANLSTGGYTPEGFSIASSGVPSPSATTIPTDDLGFPLYSDYEVFYNLIQRDGLWSDPYYSFADALSLFNSGDLEIYIRDLYSLPTVTTVVSFIDGVATPRPHTRGNPRQVYTLVPGNYTAVIEARDDEGFLILGLARDFTLTTGGDKLWGPIASFDSEVKETYDGPVEDCPRLQGTFTVDIKGLFDTTPDIPLGDNAAAVIDKSLFRVIEGEKLENQPFVADIGTIRNCTLEERDYEFGFALQYGEAGASFAAYVPDEIENLDNRWPTYTWNRTDLSTDEDLCPIIPLDIVTRSIDGRPDPTVTFEDVAPGSFVRQLLRWETLYEQTYIDKTTDPESPRVILRAPFNPPRFLDSKFTYEGVEQWIHLVGGWTDPACGGPPVPSLRSRSATASDAAPHALFSAGETPYLGREVPRGMPRR